MLTSIMLKDYTTFINETIFDFKATNSKILEDTNVGANRVLKGALFVGENASGKSQTLNAILFILELFFNHADLDFSKYKSLYTKGNKYSLSYTFNVKDNEVKYSITIDNNVISSEKLYVDGCLKLDRLDKFGHTNFREERDNKNINSNLSLVKLEYYNTRFNNDIILNEWFDFLKNSIYINCLLGISKFYNSLRSDEQIINYYLKKYDVKELNKFLNKLGYNSEIVYDSKKNNINAIGMRKMGTDVVIPYTLESNGNQDFLNIILPIIYATKNNCMLIVDEFSSGLHNELEEALIKYFFNNSKNSQIFFTSHSINLLDTCILRPDQIYTFKFDNKKGTIIKRISSENPRESQNIEKMYLNGVFDGMPKYDKEFKD